jgi:hypothetical protein
MGNQAKGEIPPEEGALTARRLSRGSDELAALDDRIVERINTLRAFLGKPSDWSPVPAPEPITAEVHPVGPRDHPMAGRMAVTQIGGESLAEIDRRLNGRINALRALAGKSDDWQPSRERAPQGTPRRYGS